MMVEFNLIRIRTRSARKFLKLKLHMWISDYCDIFYHSAYYELTVVVVLKLITSQCNMKHKLPNWFRNILRNSVNNNCCFKYISFCPLNTSHGFAGGRAKSWYGAV